METKICKDCAGKFKIYESRNTSRCDECRRAYGREDLGLNDLLNSIKNKKQRKTLERWANERTANNCKLLGTVARLYTLRKIAIVLNKPFEEANKEDITRLLAVNGFNKLYYKKLIKQFFKWLSGEDEFPQTVKWIKLNKTIEETKPERKALTDEEMLKIIKSTDNQRDKTILQILSEYPIRPKDICNLKIKDVVADEYGFELRMGSKTPKGRRDLRLINSVPDFKIYLKNHPFQNDKEYPLFYQFANNRYGQALGWDGLNNLLKKAVKRAKIKKKVNLYDFRRTTATKLLQNPNFTPEEVKVMGGWSSIRMFDVYGRVTSESVNKKILRVSGKIKSKDQLKQDLLKPIKCPRCNEENPISSLACQNCWLPLQKRAIEIKEDVIKESINWGTALNEQSVYRILKSLKDKGKLGKIL